MAPEKRLVFLDDDDPAPQRQRPAPEAKILPFGRSRAPDWLTRPGDELDTLPDPDALEAERAGLATPVLTRPGAPGTPVVPATPVAMEPGIERACESAWEAAPGPREEQAPAEAGTPAEAPRPRRQRVSDPSAPWVPAASSVPVPRLKLVEAPEPAAQEPGDCAVAAHLQALPGGEDGSRQPAAAVPGPPPLVEPWWIVALDGLRTSRRAQLVAAGALASLVLLAAWMWPRGVGTTPLSQIRRHPARYDGREVVVRGRVGDDVFNVGNGCAFYLLQGRDTIVAFSLSRTPAPRRVVTVKGQVSTGFLDGMPRQALFEGAATAGK